MIKIWIVITGFALLMLFFGGNPEMEERFRKRMEMSRDPALLALEDYREENNGSLGRGHVPSGMFNGSRNLSDSGSVTYPEYQGRGAAPGGVAPATKNAFNANRAPGANAYGLPGVSKSNTPAQLNTMTPKSPPNTWGQPYQLKPLTGNERGEVPSQGGFFLNNGGKIQMDGLRVYALDNEGKTVPLPDGHYTLDDGVPIYIKGGKRYLMN